jgi:uncharacterized protein YceK
VRRLLIVPILIGMAAGCATVKNVESAEAKPYGGLTMPCFEFFGGGQNGGFAAAGGWPIWLLDKPFTLVGDTVTLPYTLWVTRDAWLPRREPDGAPPSSVEK